MSYSGHTLVSSEAGSLTGVPQDTVLCSREAGLIHTKLTIVGLVNCV